MTPSATDYISPSTAPDLYALFCERVRRSPKHVAYRYFDKDHRQWRDIDWETAAKHVARWQQALKRDDLAPGDRVAIMLRNSPNWVFFDIAALSLGLITVPLYTEDRPDNGAYVIEHSGAKLLFIEGERHWQALYDVLEQLRGLSRVITLDGMTGTRHDPRLRWIGDWLPQETPELLLDNHLDPASLASIVYTSGTTGRPKGVMLNHRNLLSNAWGGLQAHNVYPEDVFLSFLPLSHALERTGGYYLPMMGGATVAYARSIPDLPEDLQSVRPTLMMAVPRIFERVHNRIQEQLTHKPPAARKLFERAVEVGWRRFLHQQGRASWSPALLTQPMLQRLVGRKVLEKLGGRMRFAISGGAPLPADVAHTFIGLGLMIYQGYGLTENSPVISVNRAEGNIPESVGEVVEGVEARLGEYDELLVRGASVMMGYWQDEAATRGVIDEEGWLHTGDRARIEDGHIFITGRLKEIIVLSNGEKVAPADVEMAIVADPLFEQALLVGEGRPYLSALVVANADVWKEVAAHTCGDPELAINDAHCRALLLERIGERLHDFPGYAQIRQVAVCETAWTVDNGLLTPTLKPKRNPILDRYQHLVARMYEGH